VDGWQDGRGGGEHLVDALTGLATRSALAVTVERLWVAEAGRDVGVVFADIDRMKNINNLLGHGHGDAVLAAAADLFTATLVGALEPDEPVVCARMSSDGFVAVRVGMDAATAADVGGRVAAAFRAGPLLIADPPETVTASMRREGAGYFRLYGPQPDGTYLAYATGGGHPGGQPNEIPFSTLGDSDVQASGLLVTVSVGAAAGVAGHGDWKSLIDAAEGALVDAKAGGRGVACSRSMEPS
jgi:diguanylate cyclase (GGDEF)-like protein